MPDAYSVSKISEIIQGWLSVISRLRWYAYTLSTYDETGAERELSFETSRILTDDAYLCLKVAPFRGVVTWAEVQFDEMPAAVQEQYGGNS